MMWVGMLGPGWAWGEQDLFFSCRFLLLSSVKARPQNWQHHSAPDMLAAMKAKVSTAALAKYSHEVWRTEHEAAG